MCKQGIFLSYKTEVTFKIFEIPFTGKGKASWVSLRCGNRLEDSFFRGKKCFGEGTGSLILSLPHKTLLMVIFKNSSNLRNFANCTLLGEDPGLVLVMLF